MSGSIFPICPPVSRLKGVVWLDQHNAASLKRSSFICRLCMPSFMSLAMCVTDDEQARRGWKLALRWCAGAGGGTTVRRPETMLCFDAALPTDTTGNGVVVVVRTTSWKGRVGWASDTGCLGWGETEVQGGHGWRGRGRKSCNDMWWVDWETGMIARKWISRPYLFFPPSIWI